MLYCVAHGCHVTRATLTTYDVRSLEMSNSVIYHVADATQTVYVPYVN